MIYYYLEIVPRVKVRYDVLGRDDLQERRLKERNNYYNSKKEAEFKLKLVKQILAIKYGGEVDG